MKHLLRALKGQRGFTLIELMAVMAILAVLVAVVAPSVTGTRNASINAQVMQDATQVRSAAANFYKSQNEAEVRTPHSTAVGAIVVSAPSPADKAHGTQEISTRWPEQFITVSTAGQGAGLGVGLYATEFEPLASGTNGVRVVSVTLNPKPGDSAITGPIFLGDYTAIKFGPASDPNSLMGRNLLAKMPAGAGADGKSTALGDLEISNFLWLFEKTDSSVDNADDSREVAVFKLVKVDENEPAQGGAATTVNLTYERIF